MSNCIIRDKVFADGWWNVDCVVETPTGTRTGLHTVELPEDATNAEIKAAILALYV